MTNEYYMQQALKEARRAFDEGEIPIGAIIVQGSAIIARGYNQVEKLNDSTAHAEIIALTSAFNYLGSKYLPEAVLYVTIEPCIMCAGALYWSKIGKIVFGADDEKNGSISKPPYITQGVSPFHPKTVVERGVLKEECAQLMKSFFQQKR